VPSNGTVPATQLAMVAGKGTEGPKRALNGEDQRRLASEGTSGKGEPRAASRDEDNWHRFPAGLTFELTGPRRQAP
jgi:hypothetical protein